MADSTSHTGVARIARGLQPTADGIWTNGNKAELCYPADGNAECYQLEDSSYWFKHRNDCIASIVRQFPPDGCVLDVGGGNGYVTRRLLDEGVDAVLLEPGVVGAWNAKNARRIPEVICAAFEDVVFPEAALSAVGCFDVLEHMVDDRAFLRSLRDPLQPNGLVYCTVPARQWLWSASDVEAQHHRRYDRRMVEALLAETGFELLFFSYLFLPLTLPVLVLRSLPFRLGLSNGDRVLSSAAEHGTNGGPSVRVIEGLLRREAMRIQQGNSIPLGTSCLFVARRGVVGP